MSGLPVLATLCGTRLAKTGTMTTKITSNQSTDLRRFQPEASLAKSDRPPGEAVLELLPDLRALDGFVRTDGPSAGVPEGPALYVVGVIAAMPFTKAVSTATGIKPIDPPPSPIGLKYPSRVPVSRGGNVISRHKALYNWLTDLTRAVTSGPAANAANALRTSKQVLRDTMKQEGETVEKALAKDVANGSIAKLNKRTNGKVEDLIAQYNKWDRKVDQASAGAGAARSDLDAAEKDLVAAEKLMTVDQQKAGKAAYQAEKKQLEKRMKARAGAFSSAVKLAASFVADPAGTIKSVGWKKAQEAALDLMNDGDRRRVIEIDAKIAAIDAQMKSNVSAAIRAKLSAAKSRYEGAKQKLIKANLELVGAREGRWNAVDRLASLERTYRTGSTVFRKMQTYYSQVAKLGKTVHDQSQAFIDALGADVFTKDAHRMDVWIHSDQKTSGDEMRSERAAPFRWQSKAVRAYIHRLQAWRDSEIKKHEQLQRNIEKGTHLDLADRVFGKIETAVFKHTVDRQDIRY